MHPPPRNFDLEAANWDANPARRRLAADVRQQIEQSVGLHPQRRVLDFGCGTGLLSLPWSTRIGTLTGADNSTGMLDIFVAKARKLGLNNVETLHIDLDAALALPGRFDLIVSSMTLHHIRAIEPLLARLYAALLPAGQLCLADLDPDGGLFHTDNTGVFHQGFDRDALRQGLLDAGFETVSDCTAAEVLKTDAHGQARQFTVFLMSASKGTS